VKAPCRESVEGQNTKHGNNDHRRTIMASVNRVFLMGNLTRKPEVRNTPAGLAVSDLGLAVNESYRNKDGEPVEVVCFVDVVVWGKQAEACGKYLTTGAPVMVEGRLQLDQWQTGEGEKRSRLRVRADRVQFLARREGGGKGQAEEPAAKADALELAAPAAAVAFERIPF
jgi:single-strand DNA-binding protein